MQGAEEVETNMPSLMILAHSGLLEVDVIEPVVALCSVIARTEKVRLQSYLVDSLEVRETRHGTYTRLD